MQAAWLALPRREPYFCPTGQIYAEAESRTNLFALPRREPYFWPVRANIKDAGNQAAKLGWGGEVYLILDKLVHFPRKRRARNAVDGSRPEFIVGKVYRKPGKTVHFPGGNKSTPVGQHSQGHGFPACITRTGAVCEIF